MSSTNKGKRSSKRAKHDAAYVSVKSSDSAESELKSNISELSSSSSNPTKVTSLLKNQRLENESSYDSGSSIQVIPEPEDNFFMSGDPLSITLPRMQVSPTDEKTQSSNFDIENSISRKTSPNETSPDSSSKTGARHDAESDLKSNISEPSSSSSNPTKVAFSHKNQRLENESSNDSGSSIEVIPEPKDNEIPFSNFFMSGDPSCITLPRIQVSPKDEKTLSSNLDTENSISRKTSPNETSPGSSSNTDSPELEQTTSPDTSYKLKQIELSSNDSEISGCSRAIDASPYLPSKPCLKTELKNSPEKDKRLPSPITDQFSARVSSDDSSSFENISSEKSDSSFENISSEKSDSSFENLSPETPSKSRKRPDFSPEL